MNGGVAHSFCTAPGRLSRPDKSHQDGQPDVDHKNVPLFHMSTQRPCMSQHMTHFTRSSPALVLQATNAGVRRPGNKARKTQVVLPLIPLMIDQIM